jgi:hypothetical protein
MVITIEVTQKHIDDARRFLGRGRGRDDAKGRDEEAKRGEDT